MRRRIPVIAIGLVMTVVCALAASTPGVRIKALITKPLSIGVESVWKIGRHGVKHSNLCVPPGRHPQPCPGS